MADIGQCCPTSFTTGNLANFLRAEAQRSNPKEVANKYVYVTAGSCGACRFGQYHQSYELALRNLGLESFRLFLLGQEGLDQGPTNGGGLEIDMPFTLGAIWAIVLTDVVQDMEYQIRPYEVIGGESERVAHEAVEYLYEICSSRGCSRRGATTWRNYGRSAESRCPMASVRRMSSTCHRTRSTTPAAAASRSRSARTRRSAAFRGSTGCAGGSIAGSTSRRHARAGAD